MSSRPLLMIPGPIEISPAVQAAFSVAPPGHLSAAVIEAFGRSIELMRELWQAAPSSQPFVVAGSGTLAMDMAVQNVVEPGERVVVVDTGYFSARMAEMLRRRGADVAVVAAPPGDAPALADVEAQMPCKALFSTHVDTSTGVRVDAHALAALARRHGALSVFDGVCAAAAERFEMAAWDVDVYLTASQKAIGLPPGLALCVASERALAARDALRTPPMLSVDFHAWRPVMQAYEARKPSYFATPATNLILALAVALAEHDIAERVEAHQRTGEAMRAAWRALGLSLLPVRPELCANTMSAVCYPAGLDSALIGRIKARGVIVAGGLYPGLQATYFRVGHMGYATTRSEMIERTVQAIEDALIDAGHACDRGAGVAALR